MRQVPHYLIIGNGRMATHFCTYLRYLKLPYSQWARKTHSYDSLDDLLSRASSILLLLKDSIIGEFAEKYCLSRDLSLIHFSGSFYHPKIIGAHPLMTFGPTLYTLLDYQKIPFILDEGAPDLDVLLPGLNNPYYFLPQKLKPFYHALCVLSGNFTTLLWNKLFNEFTQTFDIPASTAHPYLNQICKNLIHCPKNSLTGPLVRNDHLTLQANIHALKNDPYQSVYSAFCDAYTRSQHERS